MARADVKFAALGSEHFLFGDHPSLSPGQGVGQAEAPLPALALSTEGFGALVQGRCRGLA